MFFVMTLQRLSLNRGAQKCRDCAHKLTKWPISMMVDTRRSTTFRVRANLIGRSLTDENQTTRCICCFWSTVFSHCEKFSLQTDYANCYCQLSVWSQKKEMFLVISWQANISAPSNRDKPIS